MKMTMFAPQITQPWRPVRLAHPAFMAAPLRKATSLAQAPTTVREAVGVGVIFGLVGTALGAATSYVGFHTGVKESGFLSILGWIVGITGGMVGLSSIAGTVALVAVGPAVAERAAQQQQQQTVTVPPL